VTTCTDNCQRKFTEKFKKSLLRESFLKLGAVYSIKDSRAGKQECEKVRLGIGSVC
jgi:hypothetical protein